MKKFLLSKIGHHFEVLKNHYYEADTLKQFPLYRKGSIYTLLGYLVTAPGIKPEVMIQRKTSDPDECIEFMCAREFTLLFGHRYPDELPSSILKL